MTTFRHALGILAVVTHDDVEVGCASDDAGWHCVCDARIDNLAELTRQLAIAGAPLPDDASCARVILECYRVFDERAWLIAEGDFACAIWRPDARFVVLARDVIGSRPMYYAEEGPVMCFSSELRGAVAIRGRELRLDESQVVRHLSPIAYGVTELGHTLFDGIRRVAPGTSVARAGHRMSLSRYWDPRSIARIHVRNLQEAADELHDRVLLATLRRIDQPGALGCHLSGGLDCSSLAAMAHVHRIGGRPPLRLFSWTPRAVVSESATELKRIDALVDRYGFSIEYLDSEQFLANESTPDPLLSSPIYPNETLSVEQHVQRRARELGVRRILSGWGGDEAASHHGFGIGPELLLTGRWIRLIKFLARHEGRWSRSKLRQRCSQLVVDLAESLRQRLSGLEPQSLAADAVRRRFPFRRMIEPQIALSVREAQMAAYFSGHLTNRIESWYCHGKRFGIDYAYPLLDRRVLEFAYSLPGWCFADERGTRRVFRAAVSRYWPDDLAERTPKNETGLAGYLMRGRSFAQVVHDSDAGAHALRAAEPGETLAHVLDRQRIAEVVRVSARDPKGVDLALLSRADHLVHVVDWAARQVPATDVASEGMLR